MSNFTYKRRILLQDTDTFGVVYFARFFDFASEAFEHYLASQGLGIEKMDGNSDYVSPVSSAECKFIKPLKLGDQIEIRLKLTEANDFAIKSECEIFDQNSNLAALASFTNTFVSKTGWSKVNIPDSYRKLLRNS